jgi:hypothetical protein
VYGFALAVVVVICLLEQALSGNLETLGVEGVFKFFARECCTSMLSCVRGHCVSTELRVVHGFALAVVVIVVEQDNVAV